MDEEYGYATTGPIDIGFRTTGARIDHGVIVSARENGIRGHGANGFGVLGSSDQTIGVLGHSGGVTGVRGRGHLFGVTGQSHRSGVAGVAGGSAEDFPGHEPTGKEGVLERIPDPAGVVGMFVRTSTTQGSGSWGCRSRHRHHGHWRPGGGRRCTGQQGMAGHTRGGRSWGGYPGAQRTRARRGISLWRCRRVDRAGSTHPAGDGSRGLRTSEPGNAERERRRVAVAIPR